MGHKSCDNGGISPISIEKEMQTAYLEYAMSVIVSRAIPDVRDGLKPVQRRILYAMYENGFSWNKAHKKSARVVGEVMSKYHPHGDSAIYDALVRMAQDFSMGAILIDGQGNFGSIDADPPAAMRYTEVRLAKITHTMLEDLSFDTVDFRDNYDGLEREPVVLPATYPNVLINGSEGIAVGMATNMPPYNLGEIIDACQMYISNPSISDIDLINEVKGPDFPTGSTMVDRNAITKAMLSGRGSIIVRGKAEITELRSGKEAIIITEIPYQVVKSRLIEKIAELVREKRIDGIASIRDESNKDGIRVVVETKRDASGEIVLNQLYKFTTLQSSFAVNMLVLNANKPELMNVCSIIRTFVDFRETLVSRRINHILQKTRNRAHMMLGLHVAVDSIDRVIAIIRESVDTHAAKTQLLAMEWPASESVTQLIALVCDSKNKVIGGNFYFTEEQVKSILEMRLSRLTGLERDKIITELQQLGVQIAEHLAILADRGKIMKIISTELECVKNEFAIPRRTNIEDVNTDASIEDLMERDDMLVAITNNGYIKRTSLKTYVAQRRGGKGKSAMQTRENDDVVEILVSHTHSYILFFSNKGRVYRIKTYKLPLGSNQSKGRAIVNLLPLDKDERVTNFLSVPENDETLKNCQMIFATKNGQVRRNDVADFANINTNGKIAIGLDDGDALVGVCLARSNDNVLLATKNGMAIRFEVSSLRIVKSRSSDGVRGIMLDKNDVVISLSILANNENSAIIKEQYLNIPIEVRTSIVSMSPHELDQCVAQYKANGVLVDDFTTEHLLKLSQDERFLLTITHSGHGKRTSSYAYRITNRGGKGVINMDTTRGSVVATFVASDCDDIVLIASNGKIVRCAAESVPIVSRNTKGVRILHLAKDEKVVSISKIDNASYDDAIKDME